MIDSYESNDLYVLNIRNRSVEQVKSIETVRLITGS